MNINEMISILSERVYEDTMALKELGPVDKEVVKDRVGVEFMVLNSLCNANKALKE